TKHSARGVAMQALRTLDERLARGQHSAAACTRSCCCTYQSAGCSYVAHKLTVIDGEALALLEAIREAASRGWSNIMFESDSKTVVDAVHTKVAILSLVLLFSLLSCY
ncbi:hypothetical protein A2U01_0042926, partial [Trifolium medium]|nr:hypothetical protein [Trifolium medium]